MRATSQNLRLFYSVDPHALHGLPAPQPRHSNLFTADMPSMKKAGNDARGRRLRDSVDPHLLHGASR